MSVVITKNLVLSESVEYPLTHARIGYKKLSGTMTASSAAAGYDADYANNYLTYNFWKPEALPATLELTADSVSMANYIGIAAHEIGTSNCAVYAEYYDGSDWVTIEGIAPIDDSPIMFIFDTVTSARFRIRVAGSTAPRVGVVFVGMTLDMMRPIYGGHTPITMGRVTTLKNNRSETGQFLGRTVQRYGTKTSFDWKNLNPQWYRSEFDPFVEAARVQPFFIAWRPSKYPHEIGYVWTESDITPQNSGVRGLMDVSVQVMGLGNE